LTEDDDSGPVIGNTYIGNYADMLTLIGNLYSSINFGADGFSLNPGDDGYDMYLSGNLEVGSGMQSDGLLTAEDGLTVAGGANIDTSWDSGNTAIGNTYNTLSLTGSTITLNSEDGTTIHGGADIHGGLTVHGGSTLYGGTTINGGASINYGNLAVNGNPYTLTGANITSIQNLVINPTGTLFLGGTNTSVIQAGGNITAIDFNNGSLVFNVAASVVNITATTNNVTGDTNINTNSGNSGSGNTAIGNSANALVLTGDNDSSITLGVLGSERHPYAAFSVDATNGNTLVGGTLTVKNGADIQNGADIHDGLTVHGGSTLYGGATINGGASIYYGDLAVNGNPYHETGANITSIQSLIINPTGTLYLGGTNTTEVDTAATVVTINFATINTAGATLDFGTSDVANTINIGSDASTTNISGNTNINTNSGSSGTGDTSIGNSANMLTLTGDNDSSITLGVLGTIHHPYAAFSVDATNGNTLVGGTLTVKNGADIQNGADIHDGLTVHGGSTLYGGATINGGASINYGNLAVNGQPWTGNAVISSALPLTINSTGALNLGGSNTTSINSGATVLTINFATTNTTAAAVNIGTSGQADIIDIGSDASTTNISGNTNINTNSGSSGTGDTSIGTWQTSLSFP
jgi:hypothetical protein